MTFQKESNKKKKDKKKTNKNFFMKRKICLNKKSQILKKRKSFINTKQLGAGFEFVKEVTFSNDKLPNKQLKGQFLAGTFSDGSHEEKKLFFSTDENTYIVERIHFTKVYMYKWRINTGLVLYHIKHEIYTEPSGIKYYEDTGIIDLCFPIEYPPKGLNFYYYNSIIRLIPESKYKNYVYFDPEFEPFPKDIENQKKLPEDIKIALEQKSNPKYDDTLSKKVLEEAEALHNILTTNSEIIHNAAVDIKKNTKGHIEKVVDFVKKAEEAKEAAEAAAAEAAKSSKRGFLGMLH